MNSVNSSIRIEKKDNGEYILILNGCNENEIENIVNYISDILGEEHGYVEIDVLET